MLRTEYGLNEFDKMDKMSESEFRKYFKDEWDNIVSKLKKAIIRKKVRNRSD